jgi:hypothetical protein
MVKRSAWGIVKTRETTGPKETTKKEQEVEESQLTLLLFVNLGRRDESLRSSHLRSRMLGGVLVFDTGVLRRALRGWRECRPYRGRLTGLRDSVG